MQMRSFPDRVRHTLMFEVIGLMIIIPVSSVLLDKPMSQMGVVGLGSATIATLWNFLFNIGFDHGMRKLYGHVTKTVRSRLVHTVLFELGLLAILLPPMAWYLDMGLFETLMLDLGIVAFYLVYNFAFNIGYDKIFPLPMTPQAELAI